MSKRFQKYSLLLCVWSICCCVHAQLNTDRITAIGRNALYFEDYVLSIQYFNQVIKAKSYLAEPYMYRAIAKTQLGDYTGAEHDCTEALKRNPFLPGAYYTRGFVYMQQNEYGKAEADFTQALKFAPENKIYMLLRADAYEQLERYDEAIQDIDFLLAKEPKSAILHFEKGRISLSKQDTATAMQSFDNVVKYDPRNPVGWSARGYLRMATDDTQGALEDLTRSINLGSKWPGDYINRGVLYYKQHNYRGALADYDKAVELDPQNAQCYYNRGMLRNEVGDYNNAWEDFNTAIELEPDNMETYYHRGIVNLQLQRWQEARDDFDKLIGRYPYFLPGYYLAAQACMSLGKTKDAFAYRKTAYELDQNKENLKQQQQASAIDTDVKIAQNQPGNKDRRKEFSNRAAQNLQEPLEDTEFDSELRGTVQKKYADVVNQPNMVLTYYTKGNDIRRTNYYHPAVEAYNNLKVLPSTIKITYQEIALTAEMINRHFGLIDDFSARIGSDPDNAGLYFARAIEFALVQDFNSAIDDLNKAISLKPDFMLAYFCRANVRYKLLEYISNTNDVSAAGEIEYKKPDKVLFGTVQQAQISSENRYKFEFEMIMRDYDKVTELQPDFQYAWYNKANILCTQKDFKAAISHYTKAIEIDPDFAEAYFNRGLTRIFIDDVDNGINDLSKAGEAGIYQAYNLITRLQ